MVKRVFLYTLVSVCLIVLIALLATNMNHLSSAQAELASMQVELTRTQSDLATSQTNLATTHAKLSQTQSELTMTQDKLETTQNELATKSEKLEETDSALLKTRADYQVALAALDKEKESSEELQNDLNNLQANYDSLTDGYGYILRDLTYREVKAFLAADKTDARTYVYDSYVCEDFCLDVKTHAMQQKIRCAYVSIRFVDENAHAIVAFNTTDKGLIYIEPQSDEEVTLNEGWKYWTECVMPRPGTYYLAPTNYDDTIERFNIIW